MFNCLDLRSLEPRSSGQGREDKKYTIDTSPEILCFFYFSFKYGVPTVPNVLTIENITNLALVLRTPEDIGDTSLEKKRI